MAWDSGRNTFRSVMVPNISSSQSLERLAGTAAIIGLSLAVVIQWLSPSDESDVLLLDQDHSKNQEHHLQRGDDRGTAAAKSSSRTASSSSLSSWWWPIAMMKRRKNKRRTTSSSNYDDNNDNTANRGRNADASNVNSSLRDDGYHDHVGSCQCGSIRFILKGPNHIQPIQSPGKIEYPHIQTSADNFQLLAGEADMRFQYVQENDENSDYHNYNNSINHNGDDTSTIATEHIDKQHASSSGAHVFCGNCGVQVFYADRSSEELEVNANCLMGVSESAFTLSSPNREHKQQRQMQQQTSSVSSLSTIDGDATNNNDLSTSMRQQQLNSVSEHELFLGSAQFLSELHKDPASTSDDNKLSNDLKPSHHPRTESIASSGEQTQPESYTTMIDTPTYEDDDYSIDGSLSVTQRTIGGGGISSSASIRSVNTGLLAPLSSKGPPLSSSSESQSVRTLPPWFGERPGYASHPSVGGGWSVASIEPSDLDSVAGESTVSPRMRDQMKYYMGRHMKKKKSQNSR